MEASKTGSLAAALKAGRESAGHEAPEQALPLTFVLYPGQREIVERAIERIIDEAELRGEKNARGRALEFLAADYLGS